MGLYFLDYDASSVVLVHMKPVEHKRTTKERHHVVIPASNKLGYHLRGAIFVRRRSEKYEKIKNKDFHSNTFVMFRSEICQ